VLCEVLSDPALRHSLEAVGPERARDFRWERVCSEYEALYQNQSPAVAAGVLV
jgi:glycosyltransferase involved in cell wall biosynthesis